MTDYTVYKMGARELALTALAALAAAFGVAFVFYRSVWIAALACPLGLLYLPVRRKQLCEARREALRMQFRDLLYSLSSGLMSGRPVESALADARGDLAVLYPDADTPILKEVDVLLRRVGLSEPLEAGLRDLAARSGVEDIESFASVLATCRRTGGNLVEVVRNTANILADKAEIKNEIGVLLAQRKFEKKVLNVMPVALVLLLSFTAKDYIEPVFTTAAGRLVMTASIGLMLAAWAVSGKIMDIKV